MVSEKTPYGVRKPPPETTEMFPPVNSHAEIHAATVIRERGRGFEEAIFMYYWHFGCKFFWA
jgi:hypothetical protein